MQYIIASSLALLTALSLAALWPGLKGTMDRLLAALLLVPALMTLVTLTLGLSGLLTREALIWSHGILAVLASGAWAFRRRHAGCPAPKRLWRRARAALAQPWTWPLLLLWSGLIGWVVYVGLMVPPYGWDGLSYHLPPAVWWLQAGRVEPVPSQFTFGYAYPQGMSLLLVWQLAFTATDHLVNLVEVPFILLGMAAAFGVAREVGIGRPWALWASLFWGLAPLVVAQATVPYTDIAVAALTLVAFYFTLRFWRGQGKGDGALWLAGVAGGLILGIKPNGVLTVAAVWAMAMLTISRHSWVRGLVRRAVAMGVPGLVLAGYWYIRNVVLFRNPVFPAKVSFAGLTLLEGPRTVAQLINVRPEQSHWETFFLGLQEWTRWYSYDTPNAGYGPVFTCLGIGALLATLLHAVGRRRWRLVAVLCAGVLLLVLQPFKYSRYTLYLPALAGLSFAYLLQRLARRPVRHLLQAVAVGLMGYAGLLAPYQPQLSAETFWQVRTAQAEGRQVSSAEFGHAHHFAFMSGIPELQHPANRIAFADFDLVYPLMGDQRQNQVYHIPRREGMTFVEWEADILARRTTFLIVGAEKSMEGQIAAAHPERFVPWARGWLFRIYLVRSDDPRNQALLAARENGGEAQ